MTPQLALTEQAVEQFLLSLRNALRDGEDAQKKKALLRNVVEHGVFDG